MPKYLSMEYIDIDIEEYLNSYDIPATKENKIRVVTKWIENLQSHIGDDAHRRLEDLGVIDETGEAWKEQDVYTLKQIDAYKKYLETI